MYHNNHETHDETPPATPANTESAYASWMDEDEEEELFSNIPSMTEDMEVMTSRDRPASTVNTKQLIFLGIAVVLAVACFSAALTSTSPTVDTRSEGTIVPSGSTEQATNDEGTTVVPPESVIPSDPDPDIPSDPDPALVDGDHTDTPEPVAHDDQKQKGQEPEKDSQEADSTATIIRFSVMPRDPLDPYNDDITGVLVHTSGTGQTQIQVEHHHTEVTISDGVAHISAFKPSALHGHLEVCVPPARIPGASELMHLLTFIRGDIPTAVRAIGRQVRTNTTACAGGEQWHVRSHGEDALLCLLGQGIVSVHTMKMFIEVLDYEHGLLAEHPIRVPTFCDSKKKEIQALDASAVQAPSQIPGKPPLSQLEDMWQGQACQQCWWESPGPGPEQQQVLPGVPTPSSVDTTSLPEGDHEGSAEPAAAAKKDCVFIHGVGQTPEPGTGKILNGSYPGYWGQVNEVTPQCKSWVFLNVDTVYRGWDNRTLQEEVCAAATYDVTTGKSSMNAISNRIVFSHSMGNMALTAAIENKLCHFDNVTTSWYEVSGPMLGSKMAEQLEYMCLNTTIFEFVAQKLGFCTPTGAVAPAYASLVPGYPGLERLAKTIGPKLAGAMCGTSAFGLTSIYSAEMEATSLLAGFAQLNDGVVPWSSCSVYGKISFSGDYRSTWYAASINHIDAECYDGDGWFGDDRKPCSWYALRT